MGVPTTYPGVYIQEFAPGAPIAGVGTSTAAFIGASADGPIYEPVKITSLDQFLATFGKPLAGFFLWYAVRGFFQNGGQVCYVVRASSGTYATLEWKSSDGSKSIFVVKARQPGAPSSPIQIKVTRTNLLPPQTPFYQPTGTVKAVNGRTITLQPGDSIRFKAGDSIFFGTSTELLQILRVTGDDIVLTSDPVTPPKPADTLRFADQPSGVKTMRLFPATNPLPPGVLLPGTMLTVAQGSKMGAATDTQIIDTVQSEPIGGGKVTYRVTLRQGLKIPLSFDPALPGNEQLIAKSEDFDLEVTQGANTATYKSLALDPAHPRYYVDIINTQNDLVRIELIDPPPALQPPKNMPQAGGPTALSTADNDDLSKLTPGDANYDEKYYQQALDLLRSIDDVNLVAIPGITTASLQAAIIEHCEQLGDRFAVLDSRVGKPLFGADSVESQRKTVDSKFGYAALYYPWLRVPRVGPGAPVLVPPSGHICGVIARSDEQRGVHKAPANEIVNGALGVERLMSDTDQGQLNLEGVNVIRVFQSGGRPVVWGARTTATDTNWQYVNIRRLFLFLEESIQEGIRWAVFEPNNQGLWEKLRRTITDFLTRVWRDGALFGETADKAFYVRIDEVLNPDSERALGRLNLEIGVRPSYPAEFIIVRIGIWYGGSSATEG